MSKLLVERKNELITRAEDVLALAKTENRELTDAEAQELAEIRDDVKAIKEKLEIEDDIRDMLDGEVKEETEPKEEEKEMATEETRAFDEERMFEEYIRGTLGGMAELDESTLIGEMVIIVEKQKSVAKTVKYATKKSTA